MKRVIIGFLLLIIFLGSTFLLLIKMNEDECDKLNEGFYTRMNLGDCEILTQEVGYIRQIKYEELSDDITLIKRGGEEETKK